MPRKKRRDKKVTGFQKASRDLTLQDEITTEDLEPLTKIIREGEDSDGSEPNIEPDDKPDAPDDKEKGSGDCKALVEAINKLVEKIQGSGDNGTVEKAIAEVKIDIASLKDIVSSVRNYAEEVNQKMAEQVSKIAKITENYEKLQIKIGDIQAQVQIDAGTIDSLQSTVGELKGAANKF